MDLHLKEEFVKILNERFISFLDSEDEFIWFENSSGKYSIKGGYISLLSTTFGSYWPYKLFWHSTCLPKAGFFAWLAI